MPCPPATGKRPAGTEIILYVDNHQCVMRDHSAVLHARGAERDLALICSGLHSAYQRCAAIVRVFPDRRIVAGTITGGIGCAFATVRAHPRGDPP